MEEAEELRCVPDLLHMSLLFSNQKSSRHVCSLGQTQAFPLPPGQSLRGSSGMLLYVKSSSSLSTHDSASIDRLFQPDLTRSKRICAAEQPYSLPTDSPVFNSLQFAENCVKRAMPNKIYPTLNANFCEQEVN